MKFATTYLITNAIGMFWRNITKRGRYPIKLLTFMRYGSHILSVKNSNKNCLDRGSIIGTYTESR